MVSYKALNTILECADSYACHCFGYADFCQAATILDWANSFNDGTATSGVPATPVQRKSTFLPHLTVPDTFSDSGEY